jgi:RNA polymerase sigma-70 factor (ECF subfamily)
LEDSPDFLDRLRAGDARAFEALVTAYQHRVFGVAARMLGSRVQAEDVAQEVFLRVHRSVAAFRGEARLSTWLYGITSRLCLSRLASPGRRHERASRPLTDDTLRDPADPAAHAERGELQAALGAAIAALPEERRIVMILRDVEGLSYEEIAAALELEPGTVRSRLHRARMEIKERLEPFLT